VRCTETEGVISGNLSDRFLADHGNIFSAGFAMAMIVPCKETVDWQVYIVLLGQLSPTICSLKIR
jgi:hypothetical protein